MGLLFGLWRAFVYVHMIPSWLALGGSRPDFDRRVAIATATYYRMASSSIQSVLSYCYNSYRSAALAKQSGKPEFIAGSCSKIFFSWGMFSLGSFMNDFMRRAEKAAESCHRVEVMALTKAHVGGVHYYSGRLDQAEADLREAIGTLDKVGDWFGFFSHHMLRHLYAVRGDIPMELVEAEAEIAIGRTRGDAEASAYGQYGKADALARAGRFDEANELMVPVVEVLVARDSLALLIAYGHLGFVRLQSSDYSGLVPSLEKSRDRINSEHTARLSLRVPLFPCSSRAYWAPVGPTRMAARADPLPGKPGMRLASPASSVGVTRTTTPHALRVSGRAAYSRSARPRRRPASSSGRSRPLRNTAPAMTSLAPCSTPPGYPRPLRRLPPTRPAIARRAWSRCPGSRTVILVRL